MCVCVCVCVCVRVFMLCGSVLLTLCNPMDCNQPGFSVHGVGCHFLLQGIFLTQASIRVSCIPCIGQKILQHYATKTSLGSVVKHNKTFIFHNHYHCVSNSSLENKEICVVIGLGKQNEPPQKVPIWLLDYFDEKSKSPANSGRVYSLLLNYLRKLSQEFLTRKSAITKDNFYIQNIQPHNVTNICVPNLCSSHFPMNCPLPL